MFTGAGKNIFGTSLLGNRMMKRIVLKRKYREFGEENSRIKSLFSKMPEITGNENS